MFRLDACEWPSYFYFPLTAVTGCYGRGFSEIRERFEGLVWVGSVLRNRLRMNPPLTVFEPSATMRTIYIWYRQ